jgi:hypothetical protein
MNRRRFGHGAAALALVTPLMTACSDDAVPGRATRRADASATGDSSTGPADGPSGGPDARPTGGDAAPPLPCRNSLDCRTAPAERHICDAIYQRCVECVSNNDCAEYSECILNACRPYRPCTSSLNCETGTVCDRAIGRCVECVTTADCEQGLVCANSFCLLACQSDRQCTPFRLLCDPAAGHCVQCLRDTDCLASEHCLVGPGVCVQDRCAEGAATCRNGAVSRCAANGSAFLAPEPCGAGETCAQSATGASCVAPTCGGDASCDGGSSP